jgi:ribosomal protein L37AE/L43A
MDGLCCPTCGCEKVFHVIGGVYECTLCGRNVDQHELILIEDYKD